VEQPDSIHEIRRRAPLHYWLMARNARFAAYALQTMASAPPNAGRHLVFIEGRKIVSAPCRRCLDGGDALLQNDVMSRLIEAQPSEPASVRL
jgi:hypothetical protein